MCVCVCVRGCVFADLSAEKKEFAYKYTNVCGGARVNVCVRGVCLLTSWGQKSVHTITSWGLAFLMGTKCQVLIT